MPSELPTGPVVQKKKFVPKPLSADDATLRDIKIKMGICKRCEPAACCCWRPQNF
jgi:hypothetical protein